ncbi:MAG: tryptophan 2,3-dioxygenase family protein, partial [Bdellovibrionota bacterium]
LLAILRERFLAPDLREAFLAMLVKLGHTGVASVSKAMEMEIAGDPVVPGRDRLLEVLIALYQEPSKNLELYLLSESLVSLDQGLAHWREHHVRVVERLIGNKTGTGGSSGVGYLRATAEKKAFPILWEVRGHLKKA